MGKSTISMAIFNSFLLVHQRVPNDPNDPNDPKDLTRSQPFHCVGLVHSGKDSAVNHEKIYEKPSKNM